MRICSSSLSSYISEVGKPRVGLAPLERHPVVAVVGEQIEPLLEAVLIDQRASWRTKPMRS